MAAVLTQLLPPSPAFTEKDTPDLTGKVFIVTGGHSGVGFELVKILYSKGGTVYIACRSPTNITPALDEIRSVVTTNPGKLYTLRIDLADLTTIAPCVSEFLSRECRLDVLWNNAATSDGSLGAVTAQGHELYVGTNCLGHFLLTQLLTPVLVQTAEASPRAGVRVIFVTSAAVFLEDDTGGLSLAELAAGSHPKNKQHNYNASKAGCWFLASELDKRLRGHGILCLAPSPGTLRTKRWETASWSMRTVMSLFMHEPKMGAYTELWAGVAPELTCDDGGKFIIPWGRLHPNATTKLTPSLQTREEGGTGLAADFWDWCMEKSKGYLDNVDQRRSIP